MIIEEIMAEFQNSDRAMFGADIERISSSTNILSHHKYKRDEVNQRCQINVQS